MTFVSWPFTPVSWSVFNTESKAFLFFSFSRPVVLVCICCRTGTRSVVVWLCSSVGVVYCTRCDDVTGPGREIWPGFFKCWVWTPPRSLGDPHLTLGTTAQTRTHYFRVWCCIVGQIFPLTSWNKVLLSSRWTLGVFPLRVTGDGCVCVCVNIWREPSRNVTRPQWRSSERLSNVIKL